MSLRKIIEGVLSLFILVIIFCDLFLNIEINKWLLSLSYLILAGLIFYTTKQYYNKMQKE